MDLLNSWKKLKSFSFTLETRFALILIRSENTKNLSKYRTVDILRENWISWEKTYKDRLSISASLCRIECGSASATATSMDFGESSTPNGGKMASKRRLRASIFASSKMYQMPRIITVFTIDIVMNYIQHYTLQFNALEILSRIQIHFPLLQTILRLNIDGANTNATIIILSL
ncbi:hypothetical protein AGLY_013578 [Aphis glycines]|uniref:Uncharacterized protein n=1 Tax=Aphis glycines TaxID=307491 RepID=A0A6G0T725_APHGL|nr:hypothetical protein AGLY_013578 [Aphis glycines]